MNADKTNSYLNLSAFICVYLRFNNLERMAMKTKLCDVNPAATEKLPGKMDDKSGIGVHYMDAYLKPMNAKLPDGTSVRAKRRGLKITLTVGTKKGDGIMRRLEVSKDPAIMLDAALKEAARNAGVELSIEEGAVYITP